MSITAEIEALLNPDKKLCYRCQETKDKSEFHRRGRGLNSYCKSCWKDYAKDNPRSAESKLLASAGIYKKKFGISLTEAVKLAKVKEGLCEICTRFGRLAVDHDHSNGEIRGRLCYHCNTMLGGARDDPTILARAVAYLARYKF